MRLCLDASVLVALFVRDAHTKRAEPFLREPASVLLLSPLTRIEVVAVFQRRLRTQQLTRDEAEGALQAMDRWLATEAGTEPLIAADLATAEDFLRRFDLTLRTQDAIHTAVAQRLGASLATFDVGMATAARALGVALVAA